MLMKAIVAIVTFGVTPCGGVVGHGVSCGVPICSTAAFVDKENAEAEISNNIRNFIAIALFFVGFIFLFLLTFLHIVSLRYACSKPDFQHTNYLKQSRKFDLLQKLF